MKHKFLSVLILLCTPLAAAAGPPQAICAAVAQSHLNHASTLPRQVEAQGCMNTADGLMLEIEALDGNDGSLWRYMAMVASNPEVCISPEQDYCCISEISRDGAIVNLHEVPYNNKGQLKRDQRELGHLCEQLVAVP